MLRLAPFLAALVMTLPVTAAIIGVVLPAFGLLLPAGATAIGLTAWRRLLAEPGLWHSVMLSGWTGFASTVLALLLVVAVLAGWWGTRAFEAVERLLAPLLSVPHAAAAIGIAFLIAPSGWIVRALSPWLTGLHRPPDVLIIHDGAGLALILALTLKETPFLLLLALAAMPQTDALRKLRLAASLGYGRMAGFTFAVLPLLLRQLRLPIAAVLAFAASNVEVASILGPTTPPVLSIRLVDFLGEPDIEMRAVAAAGALLQCLVVLVLFAVLAALGPAVMALIRIGATCGLRWRCDGLVRLLAFGGAVAGAGLLFGGLAGLSLWSVAGPWRFPDAFPATLTARTWARNVPMLREPLLGTGAIAALSAGTALVLALALLEHEERRPSRIFRHAGPLLYLPLVVPQIAFLFGLDVLFLRLGLPAGIATVALGHLVFVLPYVLLALTGPWHAFDRRFADVARTLGASENRIFWRVRVPMLARPIATAAAVGIAVSVGLYLPTLLIGAGRITTVTTESVALAASGDRRLVGVLVVLQMTIPFVAFLVANLAGSRFGRPRAPAAGTRTHAAPA